MNRYPRLQLVAVERLDHVIVAPRVEPLDHVVLCRLGRHHDDRHSLVREALSYAHAHLQGGRTVRTQERICCVHARRCRVSQCDNPNKMNRSSHARGSECSQNTKCCVTSLREEAHAGFRWNACTAHHKPDNWRCIRRKKNASPRTYQKNRTKRAGRDIKNIPVTERDVTVQCMHHDPLRAHVNHARVPYALQMLQ